MKKPSIFTRLFKYITADYTKRQKIISFFIAVVIALVVILAVSSEKYTYRGFLNELDNQIIDSFFIRRYKVLEPDQILPRSKTENLVLITIGDEDIEQWPIPRSIYGKLLDILRKHGAKTVGFDITFEERSGEPSADGLYAEDRKFYNALMKMNNVFLAEHIYITNIGGKEMAVLKKPYDKFTSAVEKNGHRLGLVSIPSTEKIIRKIPAAVNFEGKTEYYLPVIMAAHFLDIPYEKLLYNPKENYIQLGNKKIQLEDGKFLRINYFFPPEIIGTAYRRYTTFSDVCSVVPLSLVLGEKDEAFLNSLFRDKIVLVGVTAVGGGDIKQTPFGHISGVYGQANVILSILGDRFITRPGLLVSLGIILLTGILLGLVIPRLTPWAGNILTIIFCIEYYRYVTNLFMHKGVIYPIIPPIVCACLCFLVINIYHHVTESKAKASFSKMFREFAPVPSDLIEKYVEQYKGSAATGGEIVHKTVLFADIRGYTQMSESMSSQEVMQVLNEYHEAMGEIFK